MGMQLANDWAPDSPAARALRRSVKDRPTAEQQDAELSYSSRQVADLCDVSFRQLDYWTRLGLLIPGVMEAAGSGSVRRWTAGDLEVVYGIGQLYRLGAHASALDEVVGLIRSSRIGAAGEWLVVPDRDAPTRHRHALPESVTTPCRVVRLEAFGDLSPAGDPTACTATSPAGVARGDAR